MPLQDFLKDKGYNINQKTTTVKPQNNIGSLTDFLGNKNLDTTAFNVASKKNKTKEKKSFFRKLGKELQKPAGILIEQIEGASYALGSLITIASPRISASQGIKRAAQELVQAQKDSWDVLRGEKETYYSDKLKQYQSALGGPSNKFQEYTMGAVGIAGDIFVDPLNKIDIVKWLDKAGDITGLTKPLSKVSSKIKSLPAIKKLKSAFSTKTGNKAFDNTVSKFRSLVKYGEEGVIEDGVRFEKELQSIKRLGKLGDKADEIIVNAIESPKKLANIKDKAIRKLITTLKDRYKNFLEASKKAGLSIGEVEEYAPRIITKDALKVKLQKALNLNGPTE